MSERTIAERDQDDTAGASNSSETMFRLRADGIKLEFAGTEAFVEKQVMRFRSFLERSVGVAPIDVAPSAAPTESVPFSEFSGSRPIRAGRGAIQDRILLAFFYLLDVQGKREVSADDLMWCFQDAEWERPKNLHNALGILKRKLEHLQEGGRRGLYQLSAKGRRYAEGRFRSTS